VNGAAAVPRGGGSLAGRVGHGGSLRRLCGLVLAAAILGADLTPAGRHALRLPARVAVAVGQVQDVALDLPGRVAVRAPRGSGSAGLWVDGAPLAATWRLLPGTSLRLLPLRPGLYTMELRLFGVLPWRAVQVRAVAVPEVVPGGQAVGIVVQARGPLVVALPPLPGARGLVPSPAARAGVHVGDYLLAVGGRAVQDAADVAAALRAALPAAAGRTTAAAAAVDVQVLRAGRTLTLRVVPVWSPALGRYLLGARVRDGASGIGTLTFRAATGDYGALGHPVTDPTLGTPIVLGSGQLLPTLIAGTERSREGRPGEKLGWVVGSTPALGTVTANLPLGVFGRLTGTLPPGPVAAPLPVALPDQVHPGPAVLLTVLRGREVQAFAVRIVAVLPQRRPSAKGLVVRVTDPRLLHATGGIVQGMSGSPIVQDGRLVGALTHVFVDDPSRGYGVLAEWMAEAAGLGDRAPADV
jgi:stage IV sporulation protein B